jgi:SlyX protein
LSSTTASRSATACGNARWGRIPMSDVKTLSDRIDVLEMRLTFQDETIETLNKTITAQWLKIDALTRQVADLSQRLREAETHAPGATNEPPPHY